MDILLIFFGITDGQEAKKFLCGDLGIMTPLFFSKPQALFRTYYATFIEILRLFQCLMDMELP